MKRNTRIAQLVGGMMLFMLSATLAVADEEDPIELECSSCSTDEHPVPGDLNGPAGPTWIGTGSTYAAAISNARSKMAQAFADTYAEVESDYECDLSDSLPPSCEKYGQNILEGYSEGGHGLSGPPVVVTIQASSAAVSVCCSECTNPL